MNHLYCFGDSHVGVFNYINKLNVLENTRISTVLVEGATSLGLVNPNSKTDALKIFNYNLQNIPKDSTLLFMLGEVDCGFVIWYRAEKYNIEVKKQLLESIRNYFAFLKHVENCGYKNIIVCTPPPPTIKDNHEWGGVANLRKEVTASQRERTELTIYYNNLLRGLCQNMNYQVLDTEKNFIDEVTGLVNKKFLNRNRLDHHLDNESAAAIYIQKLRMLGFE